MFSPAKNVYPVGRGPGGIIIFTPAASILIGRAPAWPAETVVRAAGHRTGAAVRQETVLRLVGRQLGAGQHGRLVGRGRVTGGETVAAGGRGRGRDDAPQVRVQEADRLVQRHRVPRAPSGRLVRPVPGRDVDHGSDHAVE